MYGPEGRGWGECLIAVYTSTAAPCLTDAKGRDMLATRSTSRGCAVLATHGRRACDLDAARVVKQQVARLEVAVHLPPARALRGAGDEYAAAVAND